MTTNWRRAFPSVEFSSYWFCRERGREVQVIRDAHLFHITISKDARRKGRWELTQSRMYTQTCSIKVLSSELDQSLYSLYHDLELFC